MFIIANAGSIAPNARENYFAELKMPHGGHLRMFDGKALLSLDRWATLNRVENVGETITGLLIELNFNNDLISGIRTLITDFIQDQEKPIPLERLRIGAISHYLQKPLLPKLIDINVIHQYFCRIDYQINRRLDGISGLISKENKLELANNMLIAMDKAEMLANSLISIISTIQSDLGPLAAI